MPLDLTAASSLNACFALFTRPPNRGEAALLDGSARKLSYLLSDRANQSLTSHARAGGCYKAGLISRFRADRRAQGLPE